MIRKMQILLNVQVKDKQRDILKDKQAKTITPLKIPSSQQSLVEIQLWVFLYILLSYAI